MAVGVHALLVQILISLLIIAIFAGAAALWDEDDLLEDADATLAHQQDLTAAYWQVGDVAYALVARADSGELDRAATRHGPFFAQTVALLLCRKRPIASLGS